MKIKFAFTLAEAFNHSKNIRKNAFTLAEVLVTLTIIGVVAAMTIPALMNNYQRDVYVTSLHKVYNELDQALQRRMTDSTANDLTQAGLTSQNAVNTWVESSFKFTQKCQENITPCMDSRTNYKKLESQDLGNTLNANNNAPFYLLDNGAAIRITYDYDPDKVLNILVDINGPEKPNILGRDLFYMAAYNNGDLDDWDSRTTQSHSSPLANSQRNWLFRNICKSTANRMPQGCFGQILNDNWQMKY